MANYAIGDLQGCFTPFIKLLSEVGFNPSKDHLYLVGDLIARGPDSLSCLDFVYQNQDSITVTLGNHDLHFIACHLLSKQPNPKDNLATIFENRLCKNYVSYLRTQPLAVFLESQSTFISHAGIHPSWNIHAALSYSRLAEQNYRSQEALLFFENMYGNKDTSFTPNKDPLTNFKVIVNVFTRMRFLETNENLNLIEKGAPKNSQLTPWFNHPRFENDINRYIFGHWAALEGQTHKDNVIALDTGCVWGGNMTLLNLDNNEYFLSK
jgi:bis(5'-nucleosyl)-tetraphosphatase (symmetrical)